MWTLLRQEIDRLERIAERFLSFARRSKPDLRKTTFGEVYERVAELLRAQAYGVSGVRFEWGHCQQTCRPAPAGGSGPASPGGG